MWWRRSALALNGTECPGSEGGLPFYADPLTPPIAGSVQQRRMRRLKSRLSRLSLIKLLG